MNRSPLIFALLLALAGCADPDRIRDESTGGDPLGAELLHNALLCGDDLRQPGAQWITDAATLADRYARIGAGQPDAYPPSVDFSRAAVLLITMGEQPTAGYRLNYLPPQHRARQQGTTLRLDLAWQTPEPDSVQAQIMTQPCLLLKLPRADFNRLRVHDQDGVVRLNTDLSDDRAAGS